MSQFLTVIFLFLVYCTQSFAGIQIQPSSSMVAASESLNYSFQLIDDQTMKSISDKNLVETHAKILHLVVYDKSLNEFNHVHPEYNGTDWNVKLNLPANGNYKVWAQGKTLSGNEFSVNTSLIVHNGVAEIPVSALGDVRSGTDGLTRVDLASTKIKAGKMVMIDLKISRTDGTVPQLSPYLGAFAHVIATALNGDELIHVHPMEGDEENTGMLHATFPLGGEYRLWIQFIDNGELKTIPLSVVVK